MDSISSPQMISTSFLPTGTLLTPLIEVSNEATSMEKVPFVQVKNISTMTARIRLLSSLFEEIKETDLPIPPSSILCLTELFSVIKRAKVLIESCGDGSILWNLMQTELISNHFYVVVKEMAKALDILPLSLLHLTVDTREQIELLHKQAKRVQLFVDHNEIQHMRELVEIMEKNRKNKGHVDFKRIQDLLSDFGLKSLSEYEEEILKLEGEATKQAGTGGVIVVSRINNLVSLLSLTKIAILDSKEYLSSHNDMQKHIMPMDTSDFSHSMAFNIPDEFRCPISLDLINDPVIIASGHTYDRNSISQWINTGHHTCPKSGQRLIHMALVPNYALKSLIHQWSQENNIPTTSITSSSILERTSSKRKSCDTPVDHISATKVASDAVKMTAEFLVGKLATGSPDIRRQASYEIRLLAKSGMDNRRIISEAGAIPFLVSLLSSGDPRIQENAVTALLNLSIYENNKVLIMAANAMDDIVDVLQSGLTMEARENTAALIFSLSIIDDYKIIIGGHSKAISSLVKLLGEGTTSGKRDAASALFNLAVINNNREKVILSGAVPLLIQLLTDDKAGITDDALAVLALLLGCGEGLEEIRKSRSLVPILIDLLRFGSSKGKENSITLLLGLCKNGGEEVARRLLMHPRSIPSLQGLVAEGSLKARRKADALLRILNRCCSQVTN